MLLLGLDTATAATTVAVAEVHGETCSVRAERSHVDARRHGEVVAALIQEVVQAADVDLAQIDRVAVGTGPGAYTGLRVGIATAQALAFAINASLHGVLTLDTIAFKAQRTEPFAVVTDARRREFFWASYEGFASRRSGPEVLSGEKLAQRVKVQSLVVTPDVGALPTAADVLTVGFPSAASLCALVAHRLSLALSLDDPHPRYLRTPDVTVGSAKRVLST